VAPLHPHDPQLEPQQLDPQLLHDEQQLLWWQWKMSSKGRWQQCFLWQWCFLWQQLLQPLLQQLSQAGAAQQLASQAGAQQAGFAQQVASQAGFAQQLDSQQLDLQQLLWQWWPSNKPHKPSNKHL